MVGTCANLLGVGFGFVLPTLFVSKFSEHVDYTQAEKDSFSDQIRTMLIVLSAAATVITLLVLLTFKEKPPTPPP